MQTVNLSGLDILVVDDDLMLRRRLASQLERLGADVTQAETLAQARSLVQSLPFDFALLDVNLPDGLGPDLLRARVFPAHTGVVVMTAQGGVAGAVEAMRLGALDYLTKPFAPEELLLVIERSRRARQAARIEEHKREDTSREALFFGSALASLESQLERILAADQRLQEALPPILIQGETGTGKTTLARWIHQRGPRAERPLVEVNCSALPDTLAESELFGHERGAFTDARTNRMGLFEAAHGGTLFLDELPSLSPPLQAKVLTALEDRKIRRVGSNKTIAVEVRIIAASNRDPQELVRQGHLREDLFHRLDLYRLTIPPLRERGDDILNLAELFLRQQSHRHGLSERRLSANGRRRLLTHHWPGNVRELAHEIERALVFEEGPELEFHQLPGAAAPVASAVAGPADWLNPAFQFPPQGFSLEEAINRLMQLALRQAEENVSAAARLLGVPRDYVRYRLGLKGPKGDGKQGPL